jgi:hypothetical protein
MIFVQAPPYTTFVLDYMKGETTYQMVQRIKDTYKLEFRGGFILQDTSQNTTLSGNEIVVDERIYYLTTWIASR